DPLSHTCIRPYHDRSDRNSGGPHGTDAFRADINHGKMNGFVRQAIDGRLKLCVKNPYDPVCTDGRSTDVMGYHTAAEIANYWTYARAYVLQDHMFASNSGWSLPTHLAMVSGWSAVCARPYKPMSCKTDVSRPAMPRNGFARGPIPHTHYSPYYAWTDLTYLLHKHGVSWRYYVAPGTQPDCVVADALDCPFKVQTATTPEI